MLCIPTPSTCWRPATQPTAGARCTCGVSFGTGGWWRPSLTRCRSALRVISYHRGRVLQLGLLRIRRVLHMPERTSRRTDVVIVGSGGVGVAAGLEAHEAGAQVIVLEKE